jgi:hypothetical protein
LRNQSEPLYIYDDDEEEKKDEQAPIEEAKEPTGEKPARKKVKEVQPVLRRSLRLEAKKDAKKEEEAKKESKESDEASQGILSCIAGLLSRFSGAAADTIESTSSMVLEHLVYVVSQETEPTSFQDAISGPESKEWIEAIQYEVCSIEENKTWEPCCLPRGRKVIPIKCVFKNKTQEPCSQCNAASSQLYSL